MFIKLIPKLRFKIQQTTNNNQFLITYLCKKNDLMFIYQINKYTLQNDI